MSKSQQLSRRRRREVKPNVEGMESRVVLNAAGMARVAAMQHVHHGMSLRSGRLNGTLSGSYQTAAPLSDVWASTLLLQGKGATSSARRSVLAGIVDVPQPGAGVPTLGLISIAPTGQMNDQLRLRIWSDVNTAGTPETMNWSVDPSSSGVYQNATGQGTLRLVFPRMRGAHADAAEGRFTMNLKGTLALS